MADPAELRLFIAVDLPASVKAALGKAIAGLRANLRGPYRWVSPAGIHLTLKFLGNVPADRVSFIAEAMTSAVRGHAPFPLHLDGTGTFPNSRSPSVVWAGLGGDVAALANLQRSIEASVEPLGFAPERRSFSPHLTLARTRDRLSPADVSRLIDRLSQVRFEDQEQFVVRGVSLVRSELLGAGARYSALAEAGLGA